MLAPTKSAQQGKVSQRGGVERCLASPIKDTGRKTSRYSNRALASQNSNQRQSHDCARNDCQRYPTTQLRMGVRQAQHVNRRIRSVKNLRAGRPVGGRVHFR
jgi:hypothetical protein